MTEADSRLFLSGGYDGITLYHMMMHILDLVYLPQVTQFYDRHAVESVLTGARWTNYTLVGF